MMRSRELNRSTFRARSTFRTMRVLLTIAILCQTNATIAAAPEWMSSLMKSKKAVSHTPANGKSFHPSPSRRAPNSPIKPSVIADPSAARGSAQLASSMAHPVQRGMRPSHGQRPVAVHTQSSDQYLAGVLHKAQASPRANQQFVNKFPELRSDFRRTTMGQPPTVATNTRGMASWLATGAAGPTGRIVADQVRRADQSSAGGRSNNVAVSHTGDVSGEALSDWANAPATSSQADVAVAEALAASQDPTSEPVVPEQYRNVKIDGLPADARIMYVQDRVVTPATIPGGDTARMNTEASSAMTGAMLNPPVSSQFSNNGATPQGSVTPSMQTYTISANQRSSVPSLTTSMQTFAPMAQYPLPAPSAGVPFTAGQQPVMLTQAQIAQLPPGTVLIPADGSNVASVVPHNPVAIAQFAPPSGQPPVAGPITQVQGLQFPEQPTQPMPQHRVTMPTRPAANSGPTESSIVKQQLNRAFQLSRTNPAEADNEFVRTLRYIAAAHDSAEGLNTYGEALERGFSTLDEAERIQNALIEQGEEAAIALAHSLPGDVSQSFAEGKIGAGEVIDAYHLYARHSLTIAIGTQSLGSQALYGWGQLCGSRAQTDGFDTEAERTKAITLLLAAIEADKDNWRAHNELGISYARDGEYAKSEKALRRSLALQPRAETYNNIAKVLEQQGKSDASRSSKPASRVASSRTKSESAQVAAEQPLQEDSRRDKVRAFIDRLMGNDADNDYQDDDGIPISDGQPGP